MRKVTKVQTTSRSVNEVLDAPFLDINAVIPSSPSGVSDNNASRACQWRLYYLIVIFPKYLHII